ncbi:DUF3352 domain-containing protein [Candidatus Poribacteria bacterium]|nr:DUF3352 domain-containing protein [Candidatus Poribacteria bacterium]MYK94672.1 DUF3352 domain-containing protein [Candidatus Poribacteria bacterium]
MRRKLKVTIFIFALTGIIFSANAAKVADFMPKESIFYLQLQDIDEVYSEIEVSENWEKALALLPEAVADWQEMQQGLVMAQGVLSTDLMSVIETVGYRTAFAIWLDETGTQQIGLVIHSGGNLDELQRFTKIVEGLVGMSGGGTLRLDAGVYQRVQYNAMEMPQNIVKYGFVDEFLVLGAGEEAFETLMDTYRKDAPSIRENPEFTKASKKLGSGVVSVFADVPSVLPMIGDLDEANRQRLAIFQSFFARLNLLETEPFFQAAVQFNPDLPENEIGLFLKKGAALKTPKALSAQDDLFVAIAPNILESVWELVRTEMEKNATGEMYAAISFLEGLLNLNLEEDVMTGLTGELALSVPDFTNFDPQAVDNLNLEFDGTFQLDAEGVETEGAIIFSPSNQMKWNQIGNSLSNLQNASMSQIDYNGTTVSGFASSIYYSKLNDLFLLGFSEEQVCVLVDEIKKNKELSYLKQVPKTPVAFAQLNLARILEVAGDGVPPPADKVFVSAEEIAPWLAWISVERNEVLFEIVLSTEEVPLEVLAKFVPFYVWTMEN